MKTIIILLSLISIIINFSVFADEMDCSKFKKFTAKHIECNANNLKTKTNKKLEKSGIKGLIMSYDDKIKELGINLPEAKAPVGNYVATKITGKLLFISGQISINDSGELIKGKVGKDLNTEEGYNAAKRCALSIVSQLKKACNNDLSKVKSCIKLTGFVNSTDDFNEQPKVINGASDLIASIFGDAGMHTRAAVSTNSLPLGVSVEVDAIFELN